MTVEGQIRSPHGWSRARIGWDADGRLRAPEPADGSGARDAAAAILPAMTNGHSHAFQRAMAGLAERRGDGGQDSFWSWRDVMYRFLARIGPDELLAIATMLYVECARAGYARVCEFHYLHHDPDGRRYARPAAMAEALVEAAARAGIALTLLPVLYTSSGFGGRAAEDGQRRFVMPVDEYLVLAEEIAAAARGRDALVGTAFHSLRAVTPDEMRAVLAARPAGPVHIHVAEQVREVDDCVAWSGARPVEWLLGEMPVDRRWTAVHATHMTDAEAAGLAATGATVALCPTTEANLGDGLFNANAWLAAGGRWGIGSDSHVSTDPREELRLFEYGRRLAGRARVLGADDARPHAGAWGWLGAAEGGAAMAGVDTGRIEPGARADLVALDPDHGGLIGREGDALVDAHVFGGGIGTGVRDLWVNGRHVVAGGRHPAEDEARARYRAALAGLKEGS